MSHHYREPFVQSGVLFHFTKGKGCMLGGAASHSEIIKVSLAVDPEFSIVNLPPSSPSLRKSRILYAQGMS